MPFQFSILIQKFIFLYNVSTYFIFFTTHKTEGLFSSFQTEQTDLVRSVSCLESLQIGLLTPSPWFFCCQSRHCPS